MNKKYMATEQRLTRYNFNFLSLSFLRKMAKEHKLSKTGSTSFLIRSAILCANACGAFGWLKCLDMTKPKSNPMALLCSD